MAIPSDVQYILTKLHSNGYEAYAVGGCVRDSLLSLKPNDWDITTNATPDQMAACFKDNKIIETGLKHGTLTIMLNGTGYEVTTYRIDGEYTDHRRPDSVQFVGELRLDLERRDFTVNAMAMDESETVIDLFNGQEDLRNGIIRCVGEPEKRFGEDALRLIRALRFASVYDFEIDKATADAAYRLRGTLANVSVERIFVELKKLLCGKGVYRILHDYPWIIFTVFPALQNMYGFRQLNPNHSMDVWEHTLKAISSIHPDPVYRLTMLFHDSGKPFTHYFGANGIDRFKGHQYYSAEIAKECLLYMKADTYTIKRVSMLVAEHDLMMYAAKNGPTEQLIRLGRDDFLALFPVFEADLSAHNPDVIPQYILSLNKLKRDTEAVLSSGICLTVKELNITGNDLRAIGIEGPSIGTVMNSLVRQVALKGLPNVKEALLTKSLELVKCHPENS